MTFKMPFYYGLYNERKLIFDFLKLITALVKRSYVKDLKMNLAFNWSVKNLTLQAKTNNNKNFVIEKAKTINVNGLKFLSWVNFEYFCSQPVDLWRNVFKIFYLRIDPTGI